MVFGSQERFAVESIVYQRSLDGVLGHLRLWIGGEPVGEFRQNLMLYTPALFMRDFLAQLGPRNHYSLDGKTGEEILQIVYWALYSDGEKSAEEKAHLQYRQFSDIYEKCELCPRLCPSFDGSEAVLLEEENRDRVIWKAFGQDEVREIVLHKGECLSALRGFVEWFDLVELRYLPVNL